MAKKSTKKSTKKTTKTAVKKTAPKKAAKEEKVDVAMEEDKPAKEDAERIKKLEGQDVKEGDMVYVDVLGKTIELDSAKNVVFQAGNPEDAKLLLSYDPVKANTYIPDLAIIGKQGFLMDKVDDIIKGGIKYLEEKTVKLDPVDAFGDREGKKIEKVSVRQFKKDMKEEPRPGAIYKDKKNRQGTVLRVGQGRMLVDFNHPLAGKTVEYRVKVVDKVEGFDAQVKAFIGRRLPGGMVEMFSNINHDVKEKLLEIEIPQALVFQLAQQQGGIYFKFGLSMDLQEHMPDVDTVKFSEIYAKTPVPGAGEPDDHEGHDHK